MKITWGLENASYNPKTIATLGSYDGMHRGHVEILKRLIQKKNQLSLERSVVLTFDPHPQEILRKNNTSVDLLTTIDERLALLEKTGVDETLVIRFSMDFARTPYHEFFQHVFVEKIGTKAIVVGFNHAFGKNREGDIRQLEQLASKRDIVVEEVPPLIIDGVSISSTKIRHALLEGNLKIANTYLGRPYELSGVVKHGDKIGRQIGFATANLLAPEHKLVPCDGVYAGTAVFENKSYPAAISIGNRPTIEANGERKIEAFILDFDREIYEMPLTLQFLEYIREQRKYATMAELSAQIADEILKVRGVTNR